MKTTEPRTLHQWATALGQPEQLRSLTAAQLNRVRSETAIFQARWLWATDYWMWTSFLVAVLGVLALAAIGAFSAPQGSMQDVSVVLQGAFALCAGSILMVVSMLVTGTVSAQARGTVERIEAALKPVSGVYLGSATVEHMAQAFPACREYLTHIQGQRGVVQADLFQMTRLRGQVDLHNPLHMRAVVAIHQSSRGLAFFTG